MRPKGYESEYKYYAFTVSTGATTANDAPELEPRFGITATVFLFVFNTFFAIGYLGMTWLYPAEITNLRIRIQANALSTFSNWLFNFPIVMITPPAFVNLQHRTYIMFAVFNAATFPCIWFFFPETKARSLEELDVISASRQTLTPHCLQTILQMLFGSI